MQIGARLALAAAFALSLLLGCAGMPGASAAPTALTTTAFTTIALGTAGGLEENNLSAYLLAASGIERDFVALDAGTLMAGLHKANALGSLGGIAQPVQSTLSKEAFVLQQKVKACLITHAHLDHVAGLVINSTDDSAKDILGLDATIDALRDHIFNWRIWPNFGNEGGRPSLNKYRYVRLKAGMSTPIAGTALRVEALPLSHGKGVASTMFLIDSGTRYAAYFGDTGPDAVEGSGAMRVVWQRLAPLVRTGSLRGVFIEVSYPDERPDTLLFGHMTPVRLLRELRVLAHEVDRHRAEQALRGLTVFVTHIKPALTRDVDAVKLIEAQLAAGNDLGVRFLIPRQGQKFDF